jgi:uncharacterized protein YbbC (DUF1343 family)
MKKFSLVLLLIFSSFLSAQVELGVDQLFQEPLLSLLKDKRVGLITNQSAVNKDGVPTFQLLKANQKKGDYTLKAIFAPEHGFEGNLNAYEHVKNGMWDHIPIYSLHGQVKRPTPEMLKDLDLIMYDIQNVGSRCYTYETTLFYAMEEAAKIDLTVLVLDRPDPRGGEIVEGLMPEEKFRCFFSYNKVPFCHGMTIGELADYFNIENRVLCPLQVVPMKGWKRSMTFNETGLKWIAPSPNIPDSATSLVYPATIFLGETLELVSIDLRGEHPFKRLGAPWISSDELALELHRANLPGVVFNPHSFTPKWGKYIGERCEGVFIKVTNEKTFKPLLTQYTIFEELKKLYPEDFQRGVQAAYQKNRIKTLNYITGSEDLITALENHSAITDYMKSLEELQMKEFLKKREKYLLY